MTIVVPYGAGSIADIVGRVVAGYAQQKWNSTVTIVDVPGASGVTGTLQVMKAVPDGYTLLLDSSATSSIAAAASTHLPFDIDKRTYIEKLTDNKIYFFINAKSPYHDLKQLMAFAHANPAQFSWAAAAAGSTIQFAELELLKAADVPIGQTKMVVSSGGTADANQAVASGEVLLGAGAATNIGPLVTAGKIRILAVASASRGSEFPQVPSTAELGYKNVDLSTWQALSGPSELPGNVIAKWQSLFGTAKGDQSFVRQVGQANQTLDMLSGNDLKKLVDDQYQVLLPLAVAAGVRH